MFENLHLELYSDGRVEVAGIDFGGRCELIALNEHSKVLAAKCQGYTGWFCVGQQKYYSPKVYVWRVSPEKVKPLRGHEGSRFFKIMEYLIDWDMTRKKKEKP